MKSPIPAIVTVSLFLLFLFMSATAQAQVQCWPREVLLTDLTNKYKETIVAHAITADNFLLEIFVSPNGTYSVTVMGQDKQMCLIGWGRSFELVTPLKPVGNPALYTLGPSQ